MYFVGKSPSITLNYDPTPYEGSNMTITATIHGATEVYSLSWEVIGGVLPASAKNYTYYRDGVVYSVLSLYDLRFTDRGSYIGSLFRAKMEHQVQLHILLLKKVQLCHDSLLGY